MLTAAQQTKRSPETGDLLVPVQMVAEARSRQYRPYFTWSRHDRITVLLSLEEPEEPSVEQPDCAVCRGFARDPSQARVAPPGYVTIAAV
jgi:hypothetical protein